MTEIILYRDKDTNITGGVLKGHTDYAEEGSDTVCASVSSVLFMTLNGIENVLNISFGCEAESGYAEFVFPDDLDDNDRKQINILLESMYLYYKELEGQYSKNIKITELEV